MLKAVTFAQEVTGHPQGRGCVCVTANRERCTRLRIDFIHLLGFSGRRRELVQTREGQGSRSTKTDPAPACKRGEMSRYLDVPQLTPRRSQVVEKLNKK